MPRRSNQFQKLILHVNEAFASTNAAITESAMLYDKESGCDREVDILIEDKIGMHTVRVGIECTTRNRKLNINDIEQLHTKHRNIGIGKSVIVTNAGYTNPAANYAKANNIELLTFKSAEELEWPDWLKSLKGLSLCQLSFDHTDAEVTLNIPPSINFDPKNGINIEHIKYGTLSFDDFIFTHFQTVRPNSMSHKGSDNICWCFEPPLKAIDSDGVAAEIYEITFTYIIDFIESPVQYGAISETSFGYIQAGGNKNRQNVTMLITPSDRLNDEGNPMSNITIHIDG